MTESPIEITGLDTRFNRIEQMIADLHDEWASAPTPAPVPEPEPEPEPTPVPGPRAPWLQNALDEEYVLDNVPDDVMALFNNNLEQALGGQRFDENSLGFWQYNTPAAVPGWGSGNTHDMLRVHGPNNFVTDVPFFGNQFSPILGTTRHPDGMQLYSGYARVDIKNWVLKVQSVDGGQGQPIMADSTVTGSVDLEDFAFIGGDMLWRVFAPGPHRLKNVWWFHTRGIYPADWGRGYMSLPQMDWDLVHPNSNRNFSEIDVHIVHPNGNVYHIDNPEFRYERVA